MTDTPNPAVAAYRARWRAENVLRELTTLEHAHYLPDWFAALTRERLGRAMAEFVAAMADVLPEPEEPEADEPDPERMRPGPYEPAGFADDLRGAGRGHLLGGR